MAGKKGKKPNKAKVGPAPAPVVVKEEENLLPETGTTDSANTFHHKIEKAKSVKKDKSDKRSRKRGDRENKSSIVVDETADRASPTTGQDAGSGSTDKVKLSRKRRKRSGRVPPNTQQTTTASAEGPREEGDTSEQKAEPTAAAKLCNELVEDFWMTSWAICAERFLTKAAPVIIGLELRDTWLRVVETEWLDQDQPRTDMPADIFKADNPPLPLALDSWSRGSLELTPSSRRESIMDPFLRDLGGSGDSTVLGDPGGYDMTPEGRRRRKMELRKGKKGKKTESPPMTNFSGIMKKKKKKGKSRSRGRSAKKEKKDKKSKVKGKSKSGSKSSKSKDRSTKSRTRSASTEKADENQEGKEKRPKDKALQEKIVEEKVAKRKAAKEKVSKKAARSTDRESKRDKSQTPASSENERSRDRDRSKKRGKKKKSPAPSTLRSETLEKSQDASETTETSKEKQPKSKKKSKKSKSRSTSKTSKKSAKSKTESGSSATSGKSSKKSSKSRSRSKKRSRKGKKKSKKPKSLEKDLEEEPRILQSVAQLPTPPNSAASIQKIGSFTEFCGEDQELMGEYMEDMTFLPNVPFKCVPKGEPGSPDFQKPGIPVETILSPQSTAWTDEDGSGSSLLELEMCVNEYDDDDNAVWIPSTTSLRFSEGKMKNRVVGSGSETEVDEDEAWCSSGEETEGEGTSIRCTPRPPGHVTSVNTIMPAQGRISNTKPDGEVVEVSGVIQPIHPMGPKTSVRDMKDEIIAKQREALRYRATQSLPTMKK